MQFLEEVSAKRNQKINKVEKLKPISTVKEAKQRLYRYATTGYESITKEDKTLFLKYFGIFDKEKPNGKNYFMLRVRIAGGQLTPLQARTIGEVAKKYGNDYIDITTRMQIELRYLKIEDLPTVLEKLESVGVTTYQTGIDNLRNIVTDPLDGKSLDSVITVMPLVLKMQEVFLKKDEWVGTLPRKFNTAISGNRANRCNVFSHDCSFVLAQKEGMYGFNIYLGGRVGVIARSANIFVTVDEVVPFFTALIELFKEYGFKDNRNKNRLHFFIEEVGMKNLVDAIKQRVGISYLSAGETLVDSEHSDAKDGEVVFGDESLALHVVVPAGIFTGSAMMEASQIAKESAKGIHLSIDQNFYIVGIKKENKQEVLSKPLFKEYKNVDTPFFNHMISCAGSTTCSFGVIPGKSDAIELSNYLSQNIDLDDAKIRIYWSACIKGCGIHELGNIGLLGCKAKYHDKTLLGVDILLGGKLLEEGQLAETLLKAVPLELAKFYIEELVLIYQKQREAGESFDGFYDRVLCHYPFKVVAFVVSYNYCIQRYGIQTEPLLLKESIKEADLEHFQEALQHFQKEELLTCNSLDEARYVLNGF
jgi:ferredoxin-nitrite reductase